MKKTNTREAIELAHRLGKLMAKDYRNEDADAHHVAVEELTWKLIRAVLAL